jgi:hypothetical protein
MGFNNTIYRVALFIPLTLLLATSHVKADSLQLAENPFGSQTALPEKQKLKLIASQPPKLRQDSPAGMAVYDDIATKRVGDYAEIYNPTGALIAIIWFDKFGILRSAIDRGVVLRKQDVEGVLVLVMNGDLV